MSGDPEGLVSFEAGGERYTVVFGFRAMKAVEAHYGLPFFQAMQRAMPQLSPEDAADPAKVAAAGASVSMTAVSKLFEAALSKYHPGLTEDNVDDLIDTIGIEQAGEVLGAAVAAAITKKEDGSATDNPRAKPKAGRPSPKA